MPRGIPNNGINKGRFKKGDVLSDKTRIKIKNGHLKIGERLSDNMTRLWENDEYRKIMTEKKFGNKNATGPHLSMRGNKHPMWNDGSSFEPYSVDWNLTLKKAIKERDHYVCQICGTNPEILYVHHIDYDKKNCNCDNLISLCNSCHTKTNFNREYWIRYFTEKINLMKNRYESTL